MSVVLTEGRVWQEADAMPSALAGYEKLLKENGFVTKTGYAEAFEEGGEYGEKAAKAGEKKPDAHIKLVWIDAQGHGHRVTVSYQYTNDRPPVCNMRTWDNLFEKVSDADMKQRIKDACTIN